MTVELQLWHVILLMLAWFGAVFAFWKEVMAAFKKHIDERFATQEKQRSESAAEWRHEFQQLQTLARQNERDLLEFKAKAATDWVTRNDYVRGQTVIEAKIDSVYSKLEVLQMKGHQQ